MEDWSKYKHSPAHLAIVKCDHAALRKIVASLPQLAKAGEVNTEAESFSAEKDADAVAAVVDRRDVPFRETPLHIAVRLKDAVSAEILMTSGANWSLQNEDGWSALQEALCTREESIAAIIVRHYQTLSWAKWCRRLPRILASVARIRDFYMEINFHFDSSVIPFVGKIAPSDTYRICKRGSNLRADMSLTGFDGFSIKRSAQTILFLGEGYSSADGSKSLPSGSLLVIAHKKKEITNAFDGAGVQPSETEVTREVAFMSQTNMYKPGIDVTQAELVPCLNWWNHEKTEKVGIWKAKAYDMHNVMVSVKSRRVPGAMTDKELFSANDDEISENGGNHDYPDDYLNNMLTEEERNELHAALLAGAEEPVGRDTHESWDGAPSRIAEPNVVPKQKKGLFGWKKKGTKHGGDVNSKLASEDNTAYELNKEDLDGIKKDNEKCNKKKKKKGGADESKKESEYKKGLRPVLWLTPDFPMTTEELLPLLDILANKVKAVRRLKELLTTKLPLGTFPVKLEIPIVPTVRVFITFTKFKELEAIDDEFSTPPSSPTRLQDAKLKESEGSKSWTSWMRSSKGEQSSDGESCGLESEIDPFRIPSDYAWIDVNERKRRAMSKKMRNRKHQVHEAPQNPDSENRMSEKIEG
ncbi:scaffold/adaptor protein [Lithospermum erythrorhizon]|uniref:Scaffold/adaptor protein n=1 Tax=Lithospermum erythrorhizon TaxID=34254 RepID=A0AAV3QNB7_LITER